VSGVWCLVSGGGIVGKCLWFNTGGVVWCGDGDGVVCWSVVAWLGGVNLSAGELVGMVSGVCWWHLLW